MVGPLYSYTVTDPASTETLRPRLSFTMAAAVTSPLTDTAPADTPFRPLPPTPPQLTLHPSMEAP